MRRSDARKAAELRDQFARAQKAAPELSVATDELNDSILRCEAAIAALKMGVSGYVLLGEEDIVDEHGMPRARLAQYLNFNRHDGKWRLRFEEGLTDDDPDRWKEIPLTSAPRDVRVRAVDAIGELIAMMTVEAERQTEHVRAKAKALDELTGFLLTAAKPEGE